MLPPEFKSFKLAERHEGSRNYFHEHEAGQWSFRHYFNQTHNNLNKFKKYNAILNDYQKDLDWLINQHSVPAKLKDYLIALKKKKVPENYTLKAETALPKKIRIINSKNTFNMIGNNNGNIRLGDTYNASESSSMNTKRKANDDFEEIAITKKPYQPEFVENAEEINSILGKWNKFLENKENFHPYSPEYHRVIRCGKTVSSRPSLDKELYDQHVSQHEEKEYSLPEVCMSYIDNIMNQHDLKKYRKAIRKVPEVEGKDEDTFLFVENIFQSIYNFHTTYKDIHDGETEFNGLFLFPFLNAVAAAVAAELGAAKTDFCYGEVCLEAMSTQLKALNMMVDGRNKYNADGLIRMYGYKKLEILLLETSSYFGCSDKPKSKFDHHKGLFGSLAMMKTVADEYQYASITTFKKLKIIFAHASDTTVYLWSMSFIPDESIYELWLEDILEIKPDIDDKLEAIPNFVQFYWKTKELLKQTSRIVMELKKEHDATLVRNMFKKSSDLTSLSSIVNPSILRLIEDEDKVGMAELGPIFESRGE
ncbi:hypothetical protein BDF21DRAFT_449119 [Thamnidium elegans]|nr:hypothetical protein BDF21DRAFT_449119 [Thamnidium elegans]